MQINPIKQQSFIVRILSKPLPNSSLEAIEYIISKVFASISGQLIALALMIWTFDTFDQLNHFVAAWGMILLVILALRYPIYRQISHFMKTNPSSNQLNLPLTLQFHANILFTGLAWGVGFFYFVQIAPDNLKLLSMAMIAMLGGGGILTLASSFLAYALFAVPLVSALALSFVLLGYEFSQILAIVSFIGLFYLLYTAYEHADNFHKITQHSKKIQNTQLDLIHALGKAAEYRDEETGNHILRMSHACYLVALELGFSEQQAKCIFKASTMHDIGKIGISDKILLKPGKLTDQERAIMQTHTEIGLNILTQSESETISKARVIIESHHEKWDGSGYPNQLKGYDIPIEARIAAVCDVFDALISERPYKKPWPYPEALQYLENNKGQHFDPEVVEAFKARYPQIIEYAKTHSDQML